MKITDGHPYHLSYIRRTPGVIGESLVIITDIAITILEKP